MSANAECFLLLRSIIRVPSDSLVSELLKSILGLPLHKALPTLVCSGHLLIPKDFEDMFFDVGLHAQ